MTDGIEQRERKMDEGEQEWRSKSWRWSGGRCGAGTLRGADRKKLREVPSAECSQGHDPLEQYIEKLLIDTPFLSDDIWRKRIIIPDPAVITARCHLEAVKGISGGDLFQVIKFEYRPSP